MVYEPSVQNQKFFEKWLEWAKNIEHTFKLEELCNVNILCELYEHIDRGKTSDKKWQQRLLIIRSNFVNNNHHQLMKWNFSSKGNNRIEIKTNMIAIWFIQNEEKKWIILYHRNFCCYHIFLYIAIFFPYLEIINIDLG